MWWSLQNEYLLWADKWFSLSMCTLLEKNMMKFQTVHV